jgi:hypothetical protein
MYQPGRDDHDRFYPRTVPAAGRPGRAGVSILMLAAVLAACARPAEPEPVVIRETPPPWTAPRDAAAYIAAAGLKAHPDGWSGPTRTVALHVDVDGFAVAVPAGIGVDRRREVRAVVHTDDTTGTIALDGPEAGPVTLGQFFTLWGVRFDGRCLGASCRDLYLTTGGERYIGNPTRLRLAEVEEVSISVRS